MLVSAGAMSAPLPVRNQNPLLAGFDLPSVLPAQTSESSAWTFQATFAWGNTALVQGNPRETLIVDAETQELRLVFGRSFDNGLMLRAELPYRRTHGGSLDGFIDEWHDIFGLPKGARPSMPRDALRIAYERDGRIRFDLSSPRSGLGDVSVRLGKQLGARPLAAWLAVKLPSGDANALTGSGSVDATVALSLEHAFASRYTVFAQAAATWLGDGDRLRSQQERLIASGSAGISARVRANLTLTAQLDAHTAVYDSSEDFLGDALMLSLGGSYRFAERWRFSFAVSEDLAVETAADVVLLFTLERGTS